MPLAVDGTLVEAMVSVLGRFGSGDVGREGASCAEGGGVGITEVERYVGERD